MKWLITCFEPFDRARSNSSEIVWQRLKDRNWGGECQFAGPLPVTFKDSWPALKDLLEAEKVDGVLALGQAEGRAKISLECVGLNWIDARIPDNAGDTPEIGAVLAGKNSALWSEIPWVRLGETEFWQRSYSAGTYVCNSLFFQILIWASDQRKLGGFVHIPLLQSQTESRFDGMLKMPEAKAVESIARILEFLRQLK